MQLHVKSLLRADAPTKTFPLNSKADLEELFAEHPATKESFLKLADVRAAAEDAVHALNHHHLDAWLTLTE